MPKNSGCRRGTVLFDPQGLLRFLALDYNAGISSSCVIPSFCEGYSSAAPDSHRTYPVVRRHTNWSRRALAHRQTGPPGLTSAVNSSVNGISFWFLAYIVFPPVKIIGLLARNYSSAKSGVKQGPNQVTRVVNVDTYARLCAKIRSDTSFHSASQTIEVPSNVVAGECVEHHILPQTLSPIGEQVYAAFTPRCRQRLMGLACLYNLMASRCQPDESTAHDTPVNVSPVPSPTDITNVFLKTHNWSGCRARVHMLSLQRLRAATSR